MYSVRRGLTRKLSCAHASSCQVQMFGVMSVDGIVKLATLPNRKFAQDCINELVPLGAPVLVKPKEPSWLAAFSVLLYRLTETPNLKMWAPLIHVTLSNTL